MNYYDRQGVNLTNIVIPDYARNEGKPKQELIKRGYKPKSQPSMSELVSTVAGLQKDVENACLTEQGAEEYIAKNNKHCWNVWDGDITGPNGVSDGINEVIVTDNKGNIKIVNGYTLTKTTYPQRKLYRSMYPSAEDRKANPYTQFRKNLRRITLDDGMNPSYQLEVSESYSEMYKASHPELPDPKQLFKQTIFNIVYNGFMETVVNQNEDGTRTYEASRDL